jgi:hypothetical protein
VSTISFDISALEAFAAWAAGATLCTASEDDMLTDISLTLNHFEATRVFVTSTVLSMIEFGPNTVPSLRLVAPSGKPTSLTLFKQWIGTADMWNAFGPAEVTMNTHTRRFSPRNRTSTVGRRTSRSLPSVQWNILDDIRKTTLLGCAGYLHASASEPGRLAHLSQYTSQEPSQVRNKFIPLVISHSTPPTGS